MAVAAPVIPAKYTYRKYELKTHKLWAEISVTMTVITAIQSTVYVYTTTYSRKLELRSI